MESKEKIAYTPGPWRVSNVSTRGVPQLKVETSEAGRWDRTDIAKLNVSNQQSEANARLMAAAPDMLKALIACKDRLETLYDADEATDNDIEVLGIVTSVIRAALYKL